MTTRKVTFKATQPDYGQSDVEIGLADERVYDPEAAPSDRTGYRDRETTAKVPAVRRTTGAYVPPHRR